MKTCPECGHPRGFHKTITQSYGWAVYSRCGFLMGTLSGHWTNEPKSLYCPCTYPNGRKIGDSEWDELPK